MEAASSACLLARFINSCRFFLRMVYLRRELPPKFSKISLNIKQLVYIVALYTAYRATHHIVGSIRKHNGGAVVLFCQARCHYAYYTSVQRVVHDNYFAVLHVAGSLPQSR